MNAPTTAAPTTVAPTIAAPPGSRGIDEILAASRARLRRLSPYEALRAQRDGAVLVDIRPVAQRQYGEIAGAMVVERNVLEWRFDPRSDARLPIAGSFDLPIIVYCQEGYTSSLAAAALQDLGLHRATDLEGGIAAWQAAGLPTTLAGLPPLETGQVADDRYIRILPDSRSVIVAGDEIPLTRVEFDLLTFLAEHPRRVFGRPQLLRSVWGYEHTGPRTVDVHIRRIRAKLGDRLVTTVRSVGYRLADDARISVDASIAS